MKRMVIVLCLAAATTAAVAGGCPTIVNCGEGEFGCISPGAYCCDAITGGGACKNVTPLAGPCVCDPSENPPPQTPPDPNDWSSGGKGPEDPVIGDDDGPILDLDIKREGGPCTPMGGANPPFPMLGDLVCGNQQGIADFIHFYNAAWGGALPDNIQLQNSRLCLQVTNSLAPDWWEVRFVQFNATIPSFRPNGLPNLMTGENHLVLDTLPSRGRLRASDMLLLAEINLQLTNSIFRNDYPAPVRVGLRAHINVGTSKLNVENTKIDAMTPPDYQGPRP